MVLEACGVVLARGHREMRFKRGLQLLLLRIRLVQKLNELGVACWRLGHEGSPPWDSIGHSGSYPVFGCLVPDGLVRIHRGTGVEEIASMEGWGWPPSRQASRLHAAGRARAARPRARRPSAPRPRAPRPRAPRRTAQARRPGRARLAPALRARRATGGRQTGAALLSARRARARTASSGP